MSFVVFFPQSVSTLTDLAHWVFFLTPCPGSVLTVLWLWNFLRILQTVVTGIFKIFVDWLVANNFSLDCMSNICKNNVIKWDGVPLRLIDYIRWCELHWFVEHNGINLELRSQFLNWYNPKISYQRIASKGLTLYSMMASISNSRSMINIQQSTKICPYCLKK